MDLDSSRQSMAHLLALLLRSSALARRHAEEEARAAEEEGVEGRSAFKTLLLRPAHRDTRRQPPRTSGLRLARLAALGFECAQGGCHAQRALGARGGLITYLGMALSVTGSPESTPQ